jgi:hypothetical protein
MKQGNNADLEKVNEDVMAEILSNQTTAKISEEFMTFLYMNHSFRNNVNTMFSEIYGATELLRTKIESGS